ncbi:cutinase [Ceratobasidium sp. AG-Ba]|nr:cutinase [Ceratobasidium sp. AG-Ba]
MSLSSAVQSKVIAINVFGDPTLKYGRSSSWPIDSPSVDLSPRDGSTQAQNIASFCNGGDTFCDPVGNSLAAHLAYPRDGSIAIAARFDAGRAGN